MESTLNTKGLAERVMDSARALGGGMISGGVGLERDLSDLTLRCGKGQGTVPSSRASRPTEASTRLRRAGEHARMKSQPTGNGTQQELESFAAGRQPFSGLNSKEDLMESFDVEKFLSDNTPTTSTRIDVRTTSTTSRTQSNHQCAESSAHALPSELRSLALDRLRQIEGHIATIKTATEATEAQRRTDLQSEWLLWWDESPTTCYDDSRDYFQDCVQTSYAEAWEKHLSQPAPMQVHRPYLDRQAGPRSHGTIATSRILQYVDAKKEEHLRCPDRRSHEDSTACGRSTPIAAQHRPCPHKGCGYCSTSSAGWFEHLRMCSV